MIAADGKMRETEVVDTKTLLRLFLLTQNNL